MNRDILEKVLAYIDDHIYKKITLYNLSEIAAYSPFYFSRLFSEVMGMPVTSYIRGIAQYKFYINDSVYSSGTEIILKPDTSILGDVRIILHVLIIINDFRQTLI